MLRVLEKQKLIRCMSNPRIVSGFDRPVSFQIGTESPGHTFRGYQLSALAVEGDDRLGIKFQFEDTTSFEAIKVNASLAVAPGQSIVMNAGSRHAEITEETEQVPTEETPIYVVLTPQVIK
jgi:hypothetical protein